MMTHMCIDATARAAADLGYKVSVIEDACASRDLTYKSKVVVQTMHIMHLLAPLIYFI